MKTIEERFEEFKKEVQVSSMNQLEVDIVFNKSLQDVVDGCLALAKTQDLLNDRIDMVNKRLRQLEERK